MPLPLSPPPPPPQGQQHHPQQQLMPLPLSPPPPPPQGQQQLDQPVFVPMSFADFGGGMLPLDEVKAEMASEVYEEEQESDADQTMWNHVNPPITPIAVRHKMYVGSTVTVSSHSVENQGAEEEEEKKWIPIERVLEGLPVPEQSTDEAERITNNALRKGEQYHLGCLEDEKGCGATFVEENEAYAATRPECVYSPITNIEEPSTIVNGQSFPPYTQHGGATQDTNWGSSDSNSNSAVQNSSSAVQHDASTHLNAAVDTVQYDCSSRGGRGCDRMDFEGRPVLRQETPASTDMLGSSGELGMDNTSGMDNVSGMDNISEILDLLKNSSRGRDLDLAEVR
jgi:hypothetical protein